MLRNDHDQRISKRFGRVSSGGPQTQDKLESAWIESTIKPDIVAHHLRIVGFSAAGTCLETANPLVILYSGQTDWLRVRNVCLGGRVIVGLLCASDLPDCDEFQGARVNTDPAARLSFMAAGARWRHVWTLHSSVALQGLNLCPILTGAAQLTLWAGIPIGQGHLFLVGTDLASDLVRLRQGDPAAALSRPTGAQWGFAGERPTYLFERQLQGRDPADRPADWWLWGLRTALAEHAGLVPDPVLPSGAAGLIIVTGDDDQAALADYRTQRAVLKGLATTYFLHPLTKHDAKSMAEIGAGQTVEWELHPDALESPDEYGVRLAEQARWFSNLTGRPPRLVRNHGYLNDGYWSHARDWIAEGITGSSNLPGVDGCVLNGSLLPARLALDGVLSPHWSILTAFGDGVAFIHNWSDRAMFDNVVASGRRIVDSEVPGVLVLNLHPENVARATPMHQAAMHLVERHGFKAMTLGAALDWFSARDRGERTRDTQSEARAGNLLRRAVRHLMNAVHRPMAS